MNSSQNISSAAKLVVKKRLSRFSDAVDLNKNSILENKNEPSFIDQAKLNQPLKQEHIKNFMVNSSLKMPQEVAKKQYSEDSLTHMFVEIIKRRLNNRPYYLNQSLYMEVSDRLKSKMLKRGGDLKEIVELGLVLDEQDVGKVDDFNTVFLRHAYSIVNYYTDSFKDYQGKMQKQHLRYVLFEQNSSFIDPELHEFGFMQCKIKSDKISKLEIAIVFVSPMQRAMQTCIEIMKNHPKKDTIIFYVHSGLGEMLKKDSDIFDYDKFLAQIDEATQLGLRFNTEKYFHPLWQSNIVCNEFGIPTVHHIKPLQMKNILFQIFPQPLEGFSSFHQRALRAFKDIQLLQIHQDNPKVVVISHSLVQKLIFDNLGFDTKNINGNLQAYFCKI